MKQIVSVQGQQVEQEIVLTSMGGFEAHPESYDMRVFVHVPQENRYYELLKDGQAIPWGKSPQGYLFDFWLVDAGALSISAIVVSREIK